MDSEVQKITTVLKESLIDSNEKPYSKVMMILAFPAFLGWLFPILMCLFGLAEWKNLSISNGILFTTWKKDFSYSTTLARGIVFSNVQNLYERRAERLAWHERVHVRQFEDACLYGLASCGFSALLGSGWLSLILWPVGMLFLAMNYVSAGFRFGKVGLYRDSEHERSAYAQTDWQSDGETWSEKRDDYRKTQKGVLQ